MVHTNPVVHHICMQARLMERGGFLRVIATVWYTKILWPYDAYLTTKCMSLKLMLLQACAS